MALASVRSIDDSRQARRCWGSAAGLDGRGPVALGRIELELRASAIREAANAKIASHCRRCIDMTTPSRSECAACALAR